MKTMLIIALVFSLTLCLNGQNDFQYHMVSNSALDTKSVFTIDIDGDGDMDIVYASDSGDTVAWLENLNGAGEFGAAKIISNQIDGARSVHAVDIDSDGDIDVLSAAQADDVILLHRNFGNANFAPPITIAENAIGVKFVNAADIDGDGDVDVLSASIWDNKIAWYENIDGQWAFGPQKIISTEAFGAKEVFVADMDTDGDLDVISSSSGSQVAFAYGKLAWYQNIDGQGNFGTEKVVLEGGSDFNMHSVSIGDIDNDGDIDLVTAYSDVPDPMDGELVWYENLTGHGIFGFPNLIATNIHRVRSIALSDLDGDNDMDIIFSSTFSSIPNDGNIGWVKNIDGLGNFDAIQFMETDSYAPYSLKANDINGDGSTDIIAATPQNNEIAWHENKMATSTNQQLPAFNSSIFPNPTSGIFTIQTDNSLNEIKIFNLTGKLILSSKNQFRIDLSDFDDGAYLCSIIDSYGIRSNHRVVKLTR